MDKIFLRLESNNNLKYTTCIVQYARRLIRSANSIDPMDNRIALDPSGASPQACWSVRVTDRRTRLLLWSVSFVSIVRASFDEIFSCRNTRNVDGVCEWKPFRFLPPPRGKVGIDREGKRRFSGGRSSHLRYAIEITIIIIAMINDN